jgi:3-isopropylmalate dehydrogenase
MLRYSLDAPDLANRVEGAVGKVLDSGLRTADLGGTAKTVGTAEMGNAVLERLKSGE